MAERVDAWEDACSAGMWWPYRDFVIVSVRPERIVHERVGPDGFGSHQLHCETGPALRWADGWSIWSWHGVPVPQWVVESPTVEAINAEMNSEIRRCAIESYGWDRYLTSIGAAPVDEADDPGNPGHVLRLFDTPEQIYSEPTRLLVMSNASLDRDRTRRTYAETVPAEIGSAVAAAAWQFGVDVDVYRQLERAT